VDCFEPRRAHGIDFGNSGQASTNAEQIADSEMFFGLRLDSLFSGDDQQDSVDSTGSRKHVADEKRVSGHVDKTDSQRSFIRGDCIQRRETKVDGDAAPFFFRQAIRVNAGKCTDQRRLAMIDMAGCSNDDGSDWHTHAGQIVSDGIRLLTHRSQAAKERRHPIARPAAADKRVLHRIRVRPCAGPAKLCHRSRGQ
jgi:hypothetical protein